MCCLQMSKEELVASLRRQSRGYHQNSSKFRGVTRHQKGKWEARIGQVLGRKYKYLGLFAAETDAAIAYDRAAVAAKGAKALTNFDLSCYVDLLSAPPCLLCTVRATSICRATSSCCVRCATCSTRELSACQTAPVLR